jgi:hypothetical protein
MKKLYTARVTTFIYIDEGNGSPDEYSFWKPNQLNHYFMRKRFLMALPCSR